MGLDSEGQRLREVRIHRSIVSKAQDQTKANRTASSGQDNSSLTISASRKSSPDTVLTAFAQLVALRLNTQRALISLVDRDEQLFIAESTKEFRISKDTKYDDGDQLWMGCSGKTSRKEALCSNTINATSDTDEYPCFLISDLAAHPTFCTLPYVQGVPFSRFYAGTPLITTSQHRIGSLFVMDDKPRDGISSDDLDLLGTIATNVVNYLELHQEEQQRKRGARMSRGLAAFVEGKTRIPEERKNGIALKRKTSVPSAGASDVLKGPQVSTNATWEARSSPTKIDKKSKVLYNGLTDEIDTETSEPEISKITPAPANFSDFEIQSHKSILTRASNLLQESLDVNYTVFFDAKNFSSQSGDFKPPTEERSADLLAMRGSVPATIPKNKVAMNAQVEDDIRQRSSLDLHAIRGSEEDPARVASFSTMARQNSSSTNFQGQYMTKKFVRELLKRYPKGKSWSFADVGDCVIPNNESLDHGLGISSGSGHVNHSSKNENISSGEAQILKKCFPGIRQALYVPLFDARNPDRIVACFAISLSEIPVLKTEIEVSFARAFVNSVSAELEKASTMIADRQKSEFISSISHEFRSPLHGILASTELLSDTPLAASQRSLCENIDTCGRLLLHTISHILDYTKINSFHRGQEEYRLNHQGKDVDIGSNTSVDNSLSSLNIYADTDLDRMCEDIVEIACVSHAHNNDESFLGRYARNLSDLSPTLTREANNVSVILDISPNEWIFRCIPGAILRIVSNILDNSLKFTRSGYIRIRLEKSTTKLSGEASEYHRVVESPSIVTLTVTDTGIGMSDDFQRYSLFSAFTQASSVTTGAGLGLSIVKKIVEALNGRISLQSQLGNRTEVTIQIPLDHPVAPSPTSGQALRSDSEETISKTRKLYDGKRVAFHGFQQHSDIQIRRSLEHYACQWYGLELSADTLSADVVFINEDSATLFMPNKRQGQLCIILASTHRSEATLNATAQSAEVLKMPFGPYRVAKCLLAGSESASITRSTSHRNDEKQEYEVQPLRDDIIRRNITNPTPSEGRDGQKAMKTVRSDQDSKVADANPSPQSSIPVPFIPKNAPLALPLPLKAKAKVSPSKSSRVLCVDDNHINLRLIQAYLQKLGYKDIVCVMDGLEAFDAVKSSTKPFDLIFMDITMPVCDGFESTRMIRAHEIDRSSSAIPTAHSTSFIVALTGLASERDQQEAFKAGMNHFATKPLSLVLLRKLLEEWGL